ncbi:MAG: 30S ribosome-binding factor RbfA [Planctomycetota bacterium]
MPSRRQEKVARIVRESVSDTVANRLSDPRIEGFVSVTEVDMSPDLRNAYVFLSIMADNDTVRRRTFSAIEHATRHIQARLSHRMTSKFCPHLHFREDTKMKKTLETLKLIDEATREIKEKEAQQLEDEGS